VISVRGVLDPGRPIDLETERFRLRSLKPVDASERWLGWVQDPEVVHPANAPVRHMTRQELAKYIGSHDNYTRYLIGVFDRRADSTSVSSSSTSIELTIPRPST